MSNPAPAFAGAPDRVTLGPALQHLLCVLVVAGAIKLPLAVPLYWNAALLLIGLFGLICLQALPRIMLWMVVLIGLGCIQAVAQGVQADAVPRLGQLFLLVMAASVVARIDPDLLIRYLILLLPVMVLVWMVELLLPEPLFSRRLLGEMVQRQGGLIGDPNYSAMLYGVIAILLTRRPPRALAIPPLLLALPTLSRGLVVALLAWLVTLGAGRRRTVLATALTVLLLMQPLIVFLILAATGEPTQTALARESSERILIWSAYLRMGLEDALGAGYFAGPAVSPELAPVGHPRFAHSLFMQVFGEFGWLGYLIFAGFLLHLVLRLVRRCPEELPLMIFLLSGYALVNGLSDWAFWIPIGYLLARLRLAAPPP
jgi:hypothetical protein